MHTDDLPTEILVEIFHHVQSSPPFTVGGTTLTIRISQVCRMWRNIALDTTALWSDIRLSSASSIQKLPQLLARSKESLISVSIDWRKPEMTLRHCWELSEAVMDHRSRISALHVIGPLQILSILSRVILRVGSDFPHLRHLHVAQQFPPELEGTDDPTVHKVPMWGLILHPSQLESFSITAVTLAIRSHFKHLRELHVKESGYLVHSWGEDASVGTPINFFSNLRVLSITTSPLPCLQTDPTETHIISFTLSNLRAADIPPGVLTQFFSTLLMPSLQHLTIEGLFGYLWDEFVCGLKAAQYPALGSVTFESLDLKGLDEESLGAFASVSTLRLIDVNPDPVVRILESNPLVCPRVKAVEVSMNGRIRNICGRC